MPMAGGGDRLVAGDEMEDDDVDRGWPLGEAQIRAKYHALVRRDLERTKLQAKAKSKGTLLGYDEMLEHIPATLPKLRSTREAYSRARSLQRVLRRAGLADTSGKGSQSVPVSSPSSLEHQNSSKSGDPSLVSRVDLPKPPTSSTASSQRLTCSEIYGKQTKFLAKQFKMISSSKNTTPRRNIMILGKAASPSSDGPAVIFVTGKIESTSQLQERIRVHDCDESSNPSSIQYSNAGTHVDKPGSHAPEENHRHQSRRLESSPTRLPTPPPSPSECYYYHHTDHAHANSPSSVISDDITEASVPETVLSSPENVKVPSPTRMVKLTSSEQTSLRDRWTSRELFGSFDFGGELDIDETITEASNHGRSYAPHDEIPDSESSWSLDGSVDSPSSGMRSPRQPSAGSPPEHDDYGQIRGRLAQRGGVHARRMKVTSPSSLFRDGPCYTAGDDHRKPPQTSSCPTIPRKLSRKLSTSFNKRRKQVQPRPHPHLHPPPPPPQLHALRDDQSHSSRISPGTQDHQPVESSSPGSRINHKPGNKLAVEIAALLSGFRVNDQARSKNGRRGVTMMSQQEATTAFQDDIAQLMLDRSESNEIGDIEEFLDGYMRLRSPFYLEVVEEFFRTVSYDCYKRPLGVKKKLLPPKFPPLNR